jgi:hypothetical protein
VNANVRPWLPLGGFVALALAASFSACHWVAGVEEKEYAAPVAGSQAPAKVPGRPAGATVPEGGDTLAFAVKALYYGTHRVGEQGVVDKTAWRQFGFDLDGLCTKDAALNDSNPAACLFDPSRQPSLLEDGEGCRDNSFGRNMATNEQLTQTVDLDLLTNPYILDGTTPTYLIVLEDYNGQADDPFVPGTVYLTESATTEEVDELWASGAQRPVYQNTYRFLNGYVRNGVWVAGDARVSPQGFPFLLWKRAVELEAQMVVLTLQLRRGGSQGALGALGLAVESQTLGGALGPVIVDAFLERRFEADTSQCGVAAASAAQTLSPVAAISDLAKVGIDRGVPINQGAPCSVLSLGMAFEAVPTAVPEGAGANPLSLPRLCVPPEPGGAGGSAGAGGGAGAGGEGGGDGNGTESKGDANAGSGG